MHTLVKRGSRDFYCTVCGQSWQSESIAHCPGLKVISLGSREDLMTLTQLRHSGYKTSREALPEPVGCYRTMHRGDPVYVSLYDPTQATKTRPMNRPKITHYIREVRVPLDCLPFIRTEIEEYERLYRIVGAAGGIPQLGHNRADRDSRDRIVTGICNLIASLSAFTAEETAQHGQGIVVIPVVPQVIHKRYTSTLMRREEQFKMVAFFSAAYRKAYPL